MQYKLMVDEMNKFKISGELLLGESTLSLPLKILRPVTCQAEHKQA